MTKKILSVLLTLALLFSMTATVGIVASADETQSDLSYTAISAGESKTVNITTGGEIVYYSFKPTVSGTYTFYSTGYDDTYGYLYDSDMKEIESDDDSGEGYNFSITYEFTGGEQYYFQVKYQSDSRTGSFTVTLHAHKFETTVVDPTCTEQGYTTYTCTECGYSYRDNYKDEMGHNFVGGVCEKCGDMLDIKSIAAGESKTVNINTRGEIAYFSFKPTVSDTYTFYSTGNDDTYGYLYDSDMNKIANDDDSGEGYNFSITYDLTANVQYYFGARFLEDGQTGSFSVTLEKECIHDYTTTVVDPTCTEQGYTLHTCTLCGDSYKSDYTNPTGHDVVDDQCQTCGTHINRLSLGDSKTAVIENGGEVVYFSFTPEEDGIYTFYSSSEYDTVAALYDTDMNKITNDDDSGEGYNFSITYEFTGGKQYYFQVKYYNKNRTGNFTVTLCAHDYTTTVVDPTCTEQGYTTYTCTECGYSYKDNYKDVSEHNFVGGVCEKCGTQIISAGDSKTVNINTRGEIAYFSFKPTVSDTYTFYSTGKYDTYGYLYDSDMQEIANDDDSGEDYNFSITYDLTANVQYYFGAKFLDDGRTGNFTVTLCAHDYTTTVVDPTCTEKGYTLHTCTLCGDSYKSDYTNPTGHDIVDDQCQTCGTHINRLSVGDSKTAVIENGDEVVYFNFTSDKTGKYTFSYESDKTVIMVLYDSDMNKIADNEFDDEQFENSITNMLKDGKKCYLTVSFYDENATGIINVTVTTTAYCNHEYETTEVAPTCEVDGYTLHTCKLCGDSYKDDYKDATGHSYGEWTVTKEATCNSRGIKERTCSVCGDVEKKNIALTAHSFVDDVCENCGVIIESISEGERKTAVIETAGADLWYSFTPEKSGTYGFYADTDYFAYIYIYDSDMKHITGNYIDDNYSVDWALKEGEKYYYSIGFDGRDKTGSFTVGLCQHKYETTVVEPTCKLGYTLHTCSKCGYSYMSDYVPGTGHNYVDDVCVNCSKTIESISVGESKNAVVDKLDYMLFSFTPKVSGVYTFYSIVDDNTVGFILDSDMNTIAVNDDASDDDKNFSITYSFEAGVKYYLATLFYNGRTGSFTVALKCNEHKYETTVVKPTCTEDGYTLHKCKVCGDEYKDSYTDASAHNKVTDAAVAPTCTKTGLTQGSHCSVCGEIIVKQKVVSAKGHNFGTNAKKCLVCGVKNPNYKALKKIKFDGVTYTLKNGEYVSTKAAKSSVKKLVRAKKAFKVTYSKVKGATGYQVQYSTSKKFTKKTTKSKLYKGNKKFTKTISKLKANKKYYVRVRTYKTVKINGKTYRLYSSWSKAKTVTTKK